MITPSARQSFFLVFLTAATTVSASAELLPRQSCDTLFCPSFPDLSWFWGVAGGAAAWFDNQNNGGEEETPLENFLLFRPSSSSPETFQTAPSEKQAAANRKNPKAETEIEIMVTSPGSRLSTEECIDIVERMAYYLAKLPILIIVTRVWKKWFGRFIAKMESKIRTRRG